MARRVNRERELWNRLRCGRGHDRFEAAFELASLLRNRRCLEDAECLLRDVAEHAEGATGAEAWIRLAAVLEEQGKEGYAEFAYSRAADLASPEQTPGVMLDLARHFEEIGRLELALATYESVVSGAGDRQMRAVAAFRLAKRWREIGRHEGVAELLRTALVDANSPTAIYVALLLAEELFDRSPASSSAEAGEAEHLLRTVIEADHPDLSPEAALLLARLRQQQQDLTEAYRLCQLVIDSAHPACLDLAHGLQSELLHIELIGGDSANPTPDPPDPARDPDPPARRVEPSNGVLFVPKPLGDQLRDLGEVNLGRYWQPRLIADPSPAFEPDHICPICLPRSGASPVPPEPPRLLRPIGAAVQAALRRLLGGPSLTPIFNAQVHALNLAIHLPDEADLGSLEPSSVRLLDVREQILGEFLLEAIESETLDIQAVRALIAELPLRAAPANPLERRVLVPQTRTIGEVAIGRYYGAAEEAECSLEKGYSSGRRWDFLRALVPDYVEQLCNLEAGPRIDHEFSRLWLSGEKDFFSDSDDRCAEHDNLLL